MKSALKYEIKADPSKPVEEISDFISLMLQTHPDKQIEILQKGRRKHRNCFGGVAA
ncbi:hypothetical protein RJP21_18650 [Paenibacillus sp. VCA1]|uniref:hypothetical protein n=1 Tax=Paenibacillus sp. VCA1 TaxID=3039148 RepID=UPI002871F6C0|nr:hypothetical protein [Paenibacillus sp. VCA1]MDR9855636.1 hypothetical protein [Paenibacillus sp. VCA1]